MQADFLVEGEISSDKDRRKTRNVPCFLQVYVRGGGGLVTKSYTSQNSNKIITFRDDNSKG
jgi:hypothetical protein